MSADSLGSLWFVCLSILDGKLRRSDEANSIHTQREDKYAEVTLLYSSCLEALCMVHSMLTQPCVCARLYEAQRQVRFHLAGQDAVMDD